MVCVDLLQRQSEDKMMESHAFELLFIYTGLQLLVDYSTTMDSLQVSVDRWKTVIGYWSLNHCYLSKKLLCSLPVVIFPMILLDWLIFYQS